MKRRTSAICPGSISASVSFVLVAVFLTISVESQPVQAQGPIVVPNCYVTLIDDVEVAAAVPGAVMTVDASEGMDVKAGDKLGTIDDREARTSLQLAEIDVKAAKQEAGNDVRVRYATAQYKVAVATTDNVSNWRQSTNKFFFTLISAMFGALGWWVKDGNALWDSYAPLCIAGMVACVAWWALVRQYRAINAAKRLDGLTDEVLIAIDRIETEYRQQLAMRNEELRAILRAAAEPE